jgi:hypothetical protein
MGIFRFSKMVNYEIMKFSLPMVKFTFLVIEFDFKVLITFIKVSWKISFEMSLSEILE